MVIFGAGFVIASRPKLDRRFLTMLIVVTLGAVITLGIVGTSKGEREFGEHEKGAASEHTTETTAAK